MRALARVNANKEGLVKVEADLERITGDLNLPMLTDIRSDTRRILQHIQAREERDSFDEQALHQAVQAVIREELGARSAQGQGTLRDVIQEKVSSSTAAAPASGSGSGGQLMFRLGRIRFDLLDEDDEILGEGTFGVVQSGTYMGEEVAIKKARGLIGDPAVLREFRWAFRFRSFGVYVRVFHGTAAWNEYHDSRLGSMWPTTRAGTRGQQGTNYFIMRVPAYFCCEPFSVLSSSTLCEVGDICM